jgi:hypothetical protein
MRKEPQLHIKNHSSDLPCWSFCVIDNEFTIVMEAFKEISNTFVWAWLKTGVYKEKLHVVSTNNKTTQ